jgi:tetratricopeptide (TPR) repeat protein
MLSGLVLCAVAACLAIRAMIHDRRAARVEEPANEMRDRQDPDAPPANAGPSGDPHPPRESLPGTGEKSPASSGLATPDPVTDVEVKVQALQQESRAVANRLREDYPDSLDALGLLGKVCCGYGDTAQALECWKQCLRRDPSRDDFYDAMATVALRMADYEKAAEWCRQGLEKNPEAPHLHGRLGEALSGLGRLEEAVPELKRETMISPAYAEGHFLLGQAYSLLHEYQKAKDCNAAAIKLQPKDRRYHYAQASVCARLGLDDEAQRHTDDFLKLRDMDWQYQTGHRGPYYELLYAQNSTAAVCGDAAAVYRSRRNLTKAEELLTRATALDPTKTDYRVRLAMIFTETGREPQAVELCKKLIELEPSVAAHYFNLGVIYARMRQFDAAKRMAQRALELAPDEPRCRRFYEQMEARASR